eukprot:466213_1
MNSLQQNEHCNLAENDDEKCLSIAEQLNERRSRLAQLEILDKDESKLVSVTTCETAISTQPLNNDDCYNPIINEDQEIALYLQRQHERQNNTNHVVLNQTRNRIQSAIRQQSKNVKTQNKYKRRKRRRKKQYLNGKQKLKTMNIFEEYDYHLTIMRNMKTPKYLKNILVCAYIRDVCKQCDYMDLWNLFSNDIQLLCVSFMPSLIHTYYFAYVSKLNERKKLMNIKFNLDYKQTLINCNIFIDRNYKYPINIKFIKSYQFAPDAFMNSLNGIKYILLTNAINNKEIKCLNLSNLDLNNDHLLYICNIIENVSKYYKTNFKTFINLKEMDLSGNIGITHKHLFFLSTIIKKYLFNFSRLYLKGTNNSYKSIPADLLAYVDVVKDKLVKKKATVVKQLMKRGPHGHNHF